MAKFLVRYRPHGQIWEEALVQEATSEQALRDTWKDEFPFVEIIKIEEVYNKPDISKITRDLV